MPKWLDDAVFYEVYPQSFFDSDGDGIGDLAGITEKLDYICQLGCNALWINPIYDSPFMDGGYDVRDHKKIAARYGTTEDFAVLIDTAHSKGMKILLDLVPGHTSDQNEWFLQSKRAQKNEYTDRYIFTDSVWEAPPEYRLMCGVCERDGNYLVNYFSSQPALNYGFARVTHPAWQKRPDDPECIKTAEAMWGIMRYWLDLGVDGFRVDMADSLVKNDEDKTETAKIWRRIREKLDSYYPQAALVAEWCHPERAIKNAGFHMDFYLDHYGNGYSSLFRYLVDGKNKSFFCKGGEGDITRFTDEYVNNYELTKDIGHICFMTNNHDMPRAPYYMDDDTIKLSHVMIFTMPGVPFLYYGDEIGMRYRKLTSVEGGYSRTGSRTPMQWNAGDNLGFSTANSDRLYLPVDMSINAPTVESESADGNSIYAVDKKIIALRHQYPELANGSGFEVLFAQKNRYPFVYRRGSFVVAINPSADAVEIPLDTRANDTVFSIGRASFDGKKLTMSGSSCIIART